MFSSLKKSTCMALMMPALLIGGAGYASANDVDVPDIAPREFKSLMFSPYDVSSLEKVLEAKERYDGNPLGLLGDSNFEESEVLQEIRRRTIQAQEQAIAGAALPDLYVSSIAYRSKDDWTVWLRKESYTPVDLNKVLKEQGGGSAAQPVSSGMNDNPELLSAGSEVIVLTASRPVADAGRVQAVSVTKDHIVLKYMPSASATALQKYQNKDVLTPRAKKYANRISNNAFSYATDTNEFTVELRVNQTFSLNMMRVVEGRTTAKKPSAVVAKTDPSTISSGEVTPQGDGILASSDSLEVKAANKLIGDMKKIQEFLPINTLKQP